MFCHDTFGGNVIGVMWKPAALQPKEFKVRILGLFFKSGAYNLAQCYQCIFVSRGMLKLENDTM